MRPQILHGREHIGEHIRIHAVGLPGMNQPNTLIQIPADSAKLGDRLADLRRHRRRRGRRRAMHLLDLRAATVERIADHRPDPRRRRDAERPRASGDGRSLRSGQPHRHAHVPPLSLPPTIR